MQDVGTRLDWCRSIFDRGSIHGNRVEAGVALAATRQIYPARPRDSVLFHTHAPFNCEAFAFFQFTAALQ